VLEQPVLGLPEQLGAVLQDLELHGVTVDEVVVATRFSKLAPAARQALLDIEQAGQIPVKYLAESMGFEAHLAPAAGAASARSPRTAFALDPAQLAALAARPYWRLKRTIDFAGAFLGLVLLAPPMAPVSVLVVLDACRPARFPP